MGSSINRGGRRWHGGGIEGRGGKRREEGEGEKGMRVGGRKSRRLGGIGVCVWGGGG